VPRTRLTARKPPPGGGIPIDAVQLATLVDAAPDGDAWLHERKFDGYRIVAHKDGETVRLYSRRFNDWTAQLPSVARAVAALPARRLVLDGEVAVLRPDGTTSFQALQNAFGDHPTAHLTYFVFDLIAIDGDDVGREPLDRRKQRLAGLVARAPAAATRVITYSDHVVGGGPAFFRAACDHGLEGIVSKRRDQPYAPGRGPGWVKTKCLLRQELVIGGFTEPEGSRTGLGALLVGYYQDGALIYAGKVGTGFTGRALDRLRAALAPLEVAACPFTPAPSRSWTGPRVHWVEPALVAEIAFSEWTDDGRLRHPSFKGLRADKSPRDVGREQPTATPPASASASRTAKQAARPATAARRRRAPARPAPRRRPARARYRRYLPGARAARHDAPRARGPGPSDRARAVVWPWWPCG
jgi:bifunctional non-homologous end joining protein LigD